MNDGTTNFYSDLSKGDRGEQIFQNNFLNFFQLKYQSLQDNNLARQADVDYLTGDTFWEIKNNYQDDEMLRIEEKTNCDEFYGKISLGWIFKSKATYFVFVSEKTGTMWILNNTPAFQEKYHNVIKPKYSEIKNKVTYKNGNTFQGSYYIIPVEEFKGFISVYQKF